MKQKILSLVLIMAIIDALIIMTGTSEAAPYSFSLDSFRVTGNLPGDIVEDFDDGVVAPWTIFDPTVVESGGLVNFSSPGNLDETTIDNYNVLSEMSYIGSGYPSLLTVENGAGDFTGESRWVPIVPETDQFYTMNASYELQSEPHQGIDIGINVGNWSPNAADLLGVPSGVAISFIRAGDIPLYDWVWQGIAIAESDITGDILLRLNFNDAADLFTAEFSLDGGATFQSPFAPIGWGMETPGHYEWSIGAESLDVMPVPEPSSLLLLSSGFAGLAGFGRKRLFKKCKTFQKNG